MERLRLDLRVGTGMGVVVMSDMEKGIDSAVASLLPDASHGICLFHVEKHLVKKFWSNFNGILWRAARETTREGFDACIETIRRASPAAAEYVLSKPPEK